MENIVCQQAKIRVFVSMIANTSQPHAVLHSGHLRDSDWVIGVELEEASSSERRC